MSHPIKYVLVQPNERSEIVFATAHHRALTLRVLVGSEKQKVYFDGVLYNTQYRNVTFSTFGEYLADAADVSGLVVILDVPTTFQIVKDVVVKAEGAKSEVLLVLLKINRKYVNMVEKKVGIVGEQLQFSANKFVGINDKLRELVQSNYDLNRAGFYAYGSYLDYFRANLLKKIFITDQIDVNALARSFGFTTPPRVKEGRFITAVARAEKQKSRQQARKDKKAAKQPIASQKSQQAPPSAAVVSLKKKSKKIKKSVVAK